MELIVFDLDGTLLNAESKISAYTQETLHQLNERGIVYTIATGRTLHATREVLDSHSFVHPQAYKNGVVIWNPQLQDFSHANFLTLTEIQHVLEAIMQQGLAPFMFTVEPDNRHGIYHAPLQTEVERKLTEDFKKRADVGVFAAAQMPATAEITNISALGVPHAVDVIEQMIADEPNLVAYAGTALEGAELKWIDIHHIEASKGNAVAVLKRELGIERVVCFGDSDNDLSMFATADEAYAPSNAKDSVKAAATAVIGHHDSDGIAHFLRERFNLAS